MKKIFAFRANISVERYYLARELELLKHAQVIVALGRIALEGYVRLLRRQGHNVPRIEFAHGATCVLGNPHPTLICAYHPSQPNTQPGRLTAAMMDEVLQRAREWLV